MPWVIASVVVLSCSSSNDHPPGAAVGGSAGDAAAGRGGTSGTAGAGSGGISGAGHGGGGGKSGDAGIGKDAAGGAGGAHRDASSDAPDSVGPDADTDARAAINGCKTFVDRTSDDAIRTLSWAEELADSPDRCMEVRVGQTVTFEGDFGEHPLIPFGGDKPNPIGAQTTFTEVGVFGYLCTVHPEMTGAIWVVE